MSMMLAPDELVFFNVFNNLPFPLVASDLRRLSWGLRAHPQGPSHLRVPLSLAPPHRRAAFSAAVAGLLCAIEPEAATVATLYQAIGQRSTELATTFAEMAKNRHSVWVGELDDQITWEEASLWPLACSGIFQQLLNLLVLHKRLLEQRIETLPFVTVLSEYPRHLPTALHYAFASLGAWIGGAANVQFFGLHATRAPLKDPELNQQLAQQMGFLPAEADALARSGLVALPDSLITPLLAAQQFEAPPLIGSIAADEFNVANPPDLSTAGPRRDGFLFDTHYRSAFSARDLGCLGLYGTRNVLRDHYTDFYREVPTESLVRCKHYCVPVIDVSDRAAIEQIVAAVPLHGKGGLFFRGQSRLYRIDRSPAVRQLLFADSCSDEPSLPSSASRTRGFDYDPLHFALRRFLADRLDSAEPSGDGDSGGNSPWQEACESPGCELDYALMALAQHYGLATQGLDVTTDLDVALWFALNRFERGSENRAAYQPLVDADWDPDPELWPVLLVCQQITHSVGGSLHEVQELEAFGLAASRPRAQSARFFLGGHSDHRNRLAETLVCGLRLRPGDYSLRSSFERLFPSPELDPAYRLLLEFSTHPTYRALGAASVTRFHG